MTRRRSWMLFGALVALLIACGTGAAAEKAAPALRLLVMESEAEARQVLVNIRSGASFAILAHEHSVVRVTNRYGDLGRLSYADLPDAVARILPSLREGDTSDIISWPSARFALVHREDLSNYRAGARAFRAGKYTLAEKLLTLHVLDNPDAVKARVMLGRIAEQRNEMEHAEEFYAAALAFDPDDREALSALAALRRTSLAQGRMTRQ